MINLKFFVQLDLLFLGTGRQRAGSGGGKTFGILRRRRPANKSNEGKDNKSPASDHITLFMWSDAGRLRRWEQKKSAPLRGVEGLMQPVPAHNKTYCLHKGRLDLSSRVRRGFLQAFCRPRCPPFAGFKEIMHG